MISLSLPSKGAETSVQRVALPQSSYENLHCSSQTLRKILSLWTKATHFPFEIKFLQPIYIFNLCLQNFLSILAVKFISLIFLKKCILFKFVTLSLLHYHVKINLSQWGPIFHIKTVAEYTAEAQSMVVLSEDTNQTE